MKVAQSYQKSYVVKRWKPLEFDDGDRVFLQVSPTKGVMQFGQSGKFTERVGQVVYRLKELFKVNNASHMP